MTHPITPREKVAEIIKEKVAGPHFTDPSFSVAMEQDRLAAADAILTALASGSGDHAELLAALRNKGSLPICPYDRRSPDYWTTNDTDPCKVCGTKNEVGAPDLCKGADLSVMDRAADALDALSAENAALQAERDDADRRAGAAERELEGKSDSISKRERWLRNAKEARGYHQNISFDRVWAETCAAADRATEAERKLAEAVGHGRNLLYLADGGPLNGIKAASWIEDARTFLSKEAERG